jgi:hypothetical protein
MIRRLLVAVVFSSALVFSPAAPASADPAPTCEEQIGEANVVIHNLEYELAIVLEQRDEWRAAHDSVAASLAKVGVAYVAEFKKNEALRVKIAHKNSVLAELRQRLREQS